MSNWNGYSEKGQGSQERGPSTFSYTPNNPVQQQVNTSTPTLTINNTGTGVSLNKFTYNKPTGNYLGVIDNLVKFSMDKLAPQAQKLQDMAFLRGMQRAASGEALVNIINSQPWYTKLYGNNSLVDGATSYTASAAAAKWAADTENNMSTLRREDPGNMPQYITESFNKYATGNPTADLLIQGGMLQHAPALLRRQTREHYLFQQEQAASARQDAWDAGATAIQSMLNTEPGMYLPEEIQSKRDGYLASLAYIPGQDEDAWRSSIIRHIENAAKTGNFQAIQTLRDSGVLDSFTNDERTVLDNKISQQEKLHAAQAMSGYYGEVSRINMDASQGLLNAEELVQRYAAIDADYKTRSGNRTGIFNVKEYMSGASSAMQAQAAINRANMAELAKVGSSADQNAALYHQYSAGITTGMLQHGDVPVKKLDQAFVMYLNSMVDAEGKPDINRIVDALVVDSRGGRAVGPLKTSITQWINSSNDHAISDNFRFVHSMWKTMRGYGDGGANATALYFTADEDRFLEAFDNALGTKDAQQFGTWAFKKAQEQVNATRYTLPKEDAQALNSWIKGNTQWSPVQGLRSYMPFGTGNYNLESASLQTVYNAMTPHIRATTATMVNEDDAVYKAAFDRAKGAGLEVVGRFAWVNGDDQQPLSTVIANRVDSKGLPVTPDLFGAAFNEHVYGELRNVVGSGIFTDPYRALYAMRRMDMNGVAYFDVFVQDKDGDLSGLVTFSSEDVLETLNKMQRDRIQHELNKEEFNLAAGFGGHL